MPTSRATSRPESRLCSWHVPSVTVWPQRNRAVSGYGKEATLKLRRYAGISTNLAVFWKKVQNSALVMAFVGIHEGELSNCAAGY